MRAPMATPISRDDLDTIQLMRRNRIDAYFEALRRARAMRARIRAACTGLRNALRFITFKLTKEVTTP